MGGRQNRDPRDLRPFRLFGKLVSPRSLGMGQTRSRSFLKAVSWRAIATATGVAIVVAITGEFEHGALFAGADISLKMMFYYMHERGWEMVTWGKMSEAI